MPGFGVQAATFAPGVSRASWVRAVEATAHLGFDALEVALPQVGLDTHSVRAAAHAAAVRITCRTALPAGCSALQEPERARACLGRALRAAEALGAETLCGALLYAPGEPGPAATAGDSALLVEILADLAQEAAARGVGLALEPAHRFESGVVNSLAQALALVHAVGADNLGLWLSTLQLHIGEADLREGVLRAAPFVRGVRVVENTGALPGTGAVQWAALWAALLAVDYDGFLILEAPRPWPAPDSGALGAAIADAAQMSRAMPEMELYPEEYAAQGLDFLRAGAAGAGAAAAAAPASPVPRPRTAGKAARARAAPPPASADDDGAAPPAASPSAQQPKRAKPAGKSYRSK